MLRNVKYIIVGKLITGKYFICHRLTATAFRKYYCAVQQAAASIMHTPAKYFAEIDGLARNMIWHAIHPRVTPRISHQLPLRRVKLHSEDQGRIKVSPLLDSRGKSRRLSRLARKSI